MVKFLNFLAFNSVILLSATSISCPICDGKNNADDEVEILKLYKQKSEFYRRKFRTEFSADVKQSNCDFTKGNDNCNKANPL